MRKILSFVLRRPLQCLLAALALASSAALVIAFLTAREIASPGRRVMMNYHGDFLADPSARGVAVDSFTASDGTPCLVVTPDSSGATGDRGTRIRAELTGRGVALPPQGQIRGTLVLLHGKNGRKEDFLPVAERLCAAGFRCLIPDLPAHGDHPKPFVTYGVSEAEIPARVLEEAAACLGFEKTPAALLGMSMGGSVAVHSAALPGAPWKTLVVIASFDRFSSAIQCRAGAIAGEPLGRLWADATDLFYQNKTGISMNSVQPCLKAPSIHVPVMVAHGTDDKVAPVECARSLSNSFTHSPEIRWVEIPGAGHNNVLVTNYPIYADIAEWMLRHVP